MSELKFPKPLHRGVIIKKAKSPVEDTLILPASAKTQQNEGIVMSAADDCVGTFYPNMRVVYNYLANSFILFEGEEYWLIHENDVRAEIKTDEDGVSHLLPFNLSVFIEASQGEQMVNGIIIPEVQKIHNWGKVVACGPNCKKVKKGDKVVYSMFLDTEVQFRTKNLLFGAEVDVIAILPEQATAGIEFHGRERRPDVPLDKLPENIKEDTSVKGTIIHQLNP
jgi:co-chaperonin GroES (HSP10)